MSKRGPRKPGRSGSRLCERGAPSATVQDTDMWRAYDEAQANAQSGRWDLAAVRYGELGRQELPPSLGACVANDLAVLSALSGELPAARRGFDKALTLDRGCAAAEGNLALLASEEAEPEPLPALTSKPPIASAGNSAGRIAIVSFLFNWPSTGGGIVHTVELGQFLRQAGYDVTHVFARYAPWEIGRLDQPITTPVEILEFDERTWRREEIQSRYRGAVQALDPDWVILTDSWNFKPRLAEAVRGYPYFLRQQALECLCPLNNLRLLVDGGHQVRQCPLHQLAAPDECRRCVAERGGQSGSLHQAERELAGVGTAEYDDCLRRALREAEAVLVLNPLAQAMLDPYCRDVRVVTWGMDPARFPWPWQPEPARLSDKNTLFMAGLVQEGIKGFSVLEAACAKLWRKRQDFELVVTGEMATGDPAGRAPEFTRFVGWQSQAELPRYLRAADIVVMPTIAQEGLGRTTVEAMAVGRPVIASRIGGLPYTVQDGATGLLCESGNVGDLAEKIERLLDNPAERERMGQLGRQRFEREFTWDTVIERDYRPLLTKRMKSAAV